MSADRESGTPDIFGEIDSIKADIEVFKEEFEVFKEEFVVFKEEFEVFKVDNGQRLDAIMIAIQSLLTLQPSGTLQSSGTLQPSRILQSSGTLQPSGILQSSGTISGNSSYVTTRIPAEIATPIRISHDQLPSHTPIRTTAGDGCEHANFRHLIHNPSLASTPNRQDEETNDERFLNRRMTTLSSGTLLDSRGPMVRAFTSIDPTRSGVELSYLDIPHFVSWIKDMKLLQRRHPHETLDWALFITDSATLQINAQNNAKNFIRRTIIDGCTLVLPRNELLKLIFKIVQPTSKTEYMEEFDRNVKFGKLHNNEHMSEVEVSKYDNWYKAIINYSHKANEMVELLSQDPDNDYIPCLRTINGNKGLIQHFFEGIPQGLGKSIHDSIDSNAVKECGNSNTAISFCEYTRLFQVENQKLQEGSDTVKHNRQKIKKPFEKDNENFIGHQGKLRSDFKLNNVINRNDRQLVTYSDPHRGRLNNMYDNNNNEEYENILKNYYENEVYDDYGNCYSDDNNDMYRNNDNYNNEDNESYDNYDYNNTFNIEGSNPGYNHNLNYSSPDRVPQTGMKLRPCFNEIEGKCLEGSRCQFSHSPLDLGKELERRDKSNHSSKYHFIHGNRSTQVSRTPGNRSMPEPRTPGNPQYGNRSLPEPRAPNFFRSPAQVGINNNNYNNNNNSRNPATPGILRKPITSMRNLLSAEDFLEAQVGGDNNNYDRNNVRMDEIPPATPDRYGAGNARGDQER